MNNQLPIPSQEEHRVIEFRPRGMPRVPARPLGSPVHGKGDPPEPNDLSRYEQARHQPDDFRHRMLANLAAFAFTVALMAVGIWLVVSLADLRKTQDCLLMGRRDCARISTQHF